MKRLSKRTFCIVHEPLTKIRKVHKLLNNIAIVLNSHNPHVSNEVEGIEYYVVTDEQQEKLGRLSLNATEFADFTGTLTREGKRFNVTEIEKNENYLQQVKDKGVHTGDLEGLIEDYEYVRRMLKDVFENQYTFRKGELVVMNSINKIARILYKRYETQSLYGDMEY